MNSQGPNPTRVSTQHSRSRTGCQICRRRKKKCDEVRPTCGGCQRNSLRCEWDCHDTVRGPRRQRRWRHLPDKTLPGEAREMMTIFAAPRPDMVSRLLSHFFHSSEKWLSTRTGPRRSDHLQWLLPAMSGSPLVRSCILTVSSTDLIKSNRGDPELQHLSVEFYGQAVSGLRAAMKEEATSAAISKSTLCGTKPLRVPSLAKWLKQTDRFQSPRSTTFMRPRSTSR